MQNAKLEKRDDILTITVDLSKEQGPSRSGKTTIIATSSGNKPVPDSDAVIGLNIYRKRF